MNGETEAAVAACAKSPDGEHEAVPIRDPQNGLSMTVCKHCGRTLP